MLSKILTVVLLVGVVACKKEYKKSDNDQIKTVEELNKGDYKSVIANLEGNSNLSERQHYYLASALSQAGGVDVYSLYSVMEIQLFHKKALDWSSLSDEKNPYVKFMKDQKVDIVQRTKKREERWEKYLPKLKEKHQIKEMPSYDDLKNGDDPYCAQLTHEDYSASDEFFKKAHEDVIKQKITINEFDQAWSDALKEDEQPMNCAAWPLWDYYERQTYLHFLKDQFLHPEKNTSPFGAVKWEMLYMNILWNTYEAIPLLKKLPVLTDVQQENVTKALEENLLLLKTKEFKEVSLKNVLILSGVSLLSIYSSSFDLEEVDSITDLYCTFDPHGILNNYGIIRKRLMFLLKAYESSDLKDENFLKYKDKIQAYKDFLPEELTEDQKTRYIESVDKFKVDSCFSG